MTTTALVFIGQYVVGVACVPLVLAVLWFVGSRLWTMAGYYVTDRPEGQ